LALGRCSSECHNNDHNYLFKSKRRRPRESGSHPGRGGWMYQVTVFFTGSVSNQVPASRTLIEGERIGWWKRTAAIGKIRNGQSCGGTDGTDAERKQQKQLADSPPGGGAERASLPQFIRKKDEDETEMKGNCLKPGKEQKSPPPHPRPRRIRPTPGGAASPDQSDFRKKSKNDWPKGEILW